MVNAALDDLSKAFAGLYADFGRPSIAPERLLRAMLLQAFYGMNIDLVDKSEPRRLSVTS